MLHIKSDSLCIIVFSFALFLSSCAAVGPDYKKPAVVTPLTFKEEVGWKVAQPKDAALTGKWWRLFEDATLNELEEQISITNQNIAFAAAQFRQAQALTESSKSAFYPTVSIGISETRTLGSGNTGRGKTNPATDLMLPLNLSWELDLWGRIRRSVEASTSALQASAADLAAAKLSVQSELAADYFQLRTVDAQKQYLDENISYYRKALELTQNRYTAGIVSRIDVLQADNLLKSTQASMVDLGVQRAQLEHAIALLIGKPAGSFSLPPLPLAGIPPAIPMLLPSELLERRPDIASAERHMAAANAQIGVAQAAYYPTVKLGTSVGFESSSLSSWLSWPSRFWSFGPSASATIFDGGLRRAQSDQMMAAYDATVASYRQTVLNAFREIEDNLATLRILEGESVFQDDAVNTARQTVAATMNQYKAGTASYLSVITAQATELGNRKTAIGILGRRMAAAVLLVKALGGGWSADLPAK